MLTAAGLSEAVTFGFIEAKAAELFTTTTPVPFVAVANPLSGKFDTLRPSLLPGLVDAVAHNRRHGRRDVRLFELGARFAPDGETRGVAIALDRRRPGRALVGRDTRGRLLRRERRGRTTVRRPRRSGSLRAAPRAVSRRGPGGVNHRLGRTRARRDDRACRAAGAGGRRCAGAAPSGSRVRRRAESRSARARARRRERRDASATAASVRDSRSVGRRV